MNKVFSPLEKSSDSQLILWRKTKSEIVVEDSALQVPQVRTASFPVACVA